MCNGIPVFAVANFGAWQLGIYSSIPNVYRYGIHVLHGNVISTRTWFYVNKIIILEVRKAKMNWLQALLAVNEILLKAIPGKTEIIILKQRLSLLLNFNSGT